MWQVSLLNALRTWNYATTSAALFKGIAQGQYCKSNHLVDWTSAILEDPSLDTFLPERRSIWAEDFFVFGHEMVRFCRRWPELCCACSTDCRLSTGPTCGVPARGCHT